MSLTDWPETTCYLDLWLELAGLWQLEPGGLLGYAASVAWEGDQLTFGRPAHDDLAELYGITVHELTIYRPLADHIRTQLAHGSTVIVEVDAFHLPDTAGTTYGSHHEKTTMAVLAFDGTRLDYVHSRTQGVLTGPDLDAALHGWALPPFVEIARREGAALTGAALQEAARERLGARLRRRGRTNPVTAFRTALLADGPALAASGAAGFHPYAFNTFRMLGTAFQSLGQLAAWLGDGLGDGPDGVVIAAAAGSAGAKAEQFRAARATARGRAPEPGEPLQQAEAAWDTVIDGLHARYA